MRMGGAIHFGAEGCLRPVLGRQDPFHPLPILKVITVCNAEVVQNPQDHLFLLRILHKLRLEVAFEVP